MPSPAYMQASLRSIGASETLTTVPPVVGPAVGLRARPCGGAYSSSESCPAAVNCWPLGAIRTPTAPACATGGAVQLTWV